MILQSLSACRSYRLHLQLCPNRGFASSNTSVGSINVTAATSGGDTCPALLWQKTHA